MNSLAGESRLDHSSDPSVGSRSAGGPPAPRTLSTPVRSAIRSPPGFCGPGVPGRAARSLRPFVPRSDRRRVFAAQGFPGEPHALYARSFRDQIAAGFLRPRGSRASRCEVVSVEQAGRLLYVVITGCLGRSGPRSGE